MVEVEELDVLQDRLRTNPSSLVFAHLADIFYQNEDFVRAAQICEDGLARNPHYVNGHFVYGKCLLALSETDRAEEEFNRVLLYDPEHLGAHFYLAQILQERGWEEAYLTRLETILAIDPLFEKASALLRQAEQKLAEAEPKEEPAVQEEIAAPPPEEEPIAAETEPPIFSDEDHDIEKLVAEHLEETTEAPVEEAPTAEAPPAETPTQESGIAFEEEEAKEKDFDYILDDIFEDEVMTEKQAEEDIASVVSSHVESPKEEPTVEPEAEETVLETAEAAEEVVEEEVVEEETVEEETPAVSEEEPLTEEPEAEVQEAPEEAAPEPPPRAPESYDIQEEKKDTAAIVTPTLGEIYAAQGHYAKAIGVYEILLKKDPQNEAYREKIQYLKKKLAEEAAQSGE